MQTRWNRAREAAEGKDHACTIKTANLTRHADGMKTQQWPYPPHTECKFCRSRASNHVLGLLEVNQHGPGQLPNVATAIVSKPAAVIIREWIESVTPKAGDVSAVSP